MDKTISSVVLGFFFVEAFVVCLVVVGFWVVAGSLVVADSFVVQVGW